MSFFAKRGDTLSGLKLDIFRDTFLYDKIAEHWNTLFSPDSGNCQKNTPGSVYPMRLLYSEPAAIYEKRKS